MKESKTEESKREESKKEESKTEESKINIKIYKIVNNVNDEFYIGSTMNELRKRFYQHKVFSKKDKYKNINLYKLAKKIGWDKFRMILIDEFEVENQMYQLKKEQEFIDLLKPSLNRSVVE